MKGVSTILMVAIIGLFIVATPKKGYCSSRSDDILPAWVKNPPKPLNSTYQFKVVETDAGSDLSSARKHSQKELIRSIEREFNIKVSDELQSQSVTAYNGGDGDISFSSKDIYSLNIQSDDGNVEIYYERVDEYYRTEWVSDNKIFRLYTLYAVARPEIRRAHFDNFEKTDRYGVSGVWRSTIVPGWGQLYKGSRAKGGLILGGTVALVGGIIATENLRGNYTEMMYETHDVNAIRNYATKVDNMTNIRNLCIGGAAALYIYSLIDAAVAPGAKRVVVKQGSLRKLALVPAFTPDVTGVTLTYKF